MFVDIICVRDKKKKIQAKKTTFMENSRFCTPSCLTPPGGGGGALDFK